MTAISPVAAAPAQASTPVLPDEWNDSCSCFLVLCSADLDDDPDQRLRLYTHAARRAVQDAYAFHGHTLHVDPAASSPTTTSSNVSTWMDVLITGAQDPWSRVRSVAADGLCASVMAAMADPTAGDADEAHNEVDAEAKEHCHRPGSRSHGRADDDDESFVLVSASSTPQRRSSVASGSHMYSTGGGGRRRAGSGVRGGAASQNMSALSGVYSTGHSPQPAKRLSFIGASDTRTPVTAPTVAVTPTKQQLHAQKVLRRFALDTFSKLLVKWGRAQHWYEREGMLRVWQLLLPVVMAVAEDTVAKRLVQSVCLPALKDPQVPVRDAASTLLASIASASPVLAAAAMDSVRQSLEQLAGQQTQHQSAVAGVGQLDEAAAYAAEGYLKGLLKLCDADQATQRASAAESRVGDSVVAPTALESFAPLLMRFASHPASSVRQCVAAALGTHSETLFALLTRALAGITVSPAAQLGTAVATAATDADADADGPDALGGAPHAPVMWQFQETVLMALSEHLRFYLSQGSHYQLDLVELFTLTEDRAWVAAFCAGGPAPPDMLAPLAQLAPDLNTARRMSPEALTAALAQSRKYATMQQCLCVLCDAAQSTHFETARMSLQVVPLFLQLWVRFSTHMDELLYVLHHAVPSEVFVKAAAEAASSSDEEAIVAALAATPSFYFYTKAVLAPLWWFLTVRVYTSQVHEWASLSSLVRRYGTPYYWLRRVASAHVGRADGGGVDDDGDADRDAVDRSAPTAEASLRLLKPLLPHLCSVNVLIATYFTPLLHGADRDAEEETMNRHLLVLEPELWEALLAAGPPSAVSALKTVVPTRAYLHVGLDFVAGLWWRQRLSSRSGCEPSRLVLQRVQRLAPVWVRALATLQTHQQCTVLGMTRVALGVDALPDRLVLAGCPTPTSRGGRRSTLGLSLLSLSTGDGAGAGGAGAGAVPHLFRFVYRSTLRAPAMLDGGEDVPRGYTWLRQCFPVEMDAPTVDCLHLGESHPQGDLEDGTEDGAVCAVSLPLEASVEEAVVTHIFRTLYVDPGVEPSVLREVRLLMAGLCLLAQEPLHHTHVDWCSETVSAVLHRLDCIGPNWLATTIASEPAPAAATAAGADESSDCDNWDDDSEEDEAVQGISVAQEVREAKTLLSQVLVGNRGAEAGASDADDDNTNSAKLRALLSAPV